MAVKKSYGKKDINIEKIRKDFPMLQTKRNGKQLIYLDSAASGQKPNCVMECLQRLYMKEYAKPNEEHNLSKHITDQLEDTRKKVAQFMNARSEKEIIFTRGCTESINIIAFAFERGILKKGDEILITQMEHHANIVPWLMACENTGAKLKVVPVTGTGELDMNVFERMITSKTRLISVVHSSHVLGTVLPVRAITALAGTHNIPVLVDGAQAAPHMPVDVQDLGCDFYTFSGHKMGSPSGVGVLYGKKKWLQKLPGAEGGGDMAKKVTFSSFEYEELSKKFEAGTMPFAETIAFGAVIDYVNEIGMQKIKEYELSLLQYAEEQLSMIREVKIIGSAPEKEPVLSFSIKGVRPKKLEKFLSDEYNIIIRSGDLTAQPLMEALGVKELVRISFCYYNTTAEIDYFIHALKKYMA